MIRTLCNCIVLSCVITLLLCIWIAGVNTPPQPLPVEQPEYPVWIRIEQGQEMSPADFERWRLQQQRRQQVSYRV